MTNGKCQVHGGKTPVGIASSSYKHGRYSRNLPTRLAARYNEAVNDPNLVSLHEDIALVDARLEDVLAKVDTGESGAIWVTLKKVAEDAQSDDPKINSPARYQLFSLIDKGFDDYAAWHDVRGLLEQRRKIAESEHKRLVAMEQLITTDQAMMLMRGMINAVKANVTDRDALAAIQTEFTRLATFDVQRTNA